MGFGMFFSAIKVVRKANKVRQMGADAFRNLDDEDLYNAMDCLTDFFLINLEDEQLPRELKMAYCLLTFEREVNNGGLCQFFVNSSRECAPFIGEALETIGDTELKETWERFIGDNQIDVNDLSSFDIESVDEFEAQTERYDFDGFDNSFYEDEMFSTLMLQYFRNNAEALLKER